LSLTQTFTGRSRFRTDHTYEQYLLFVAITCTVDDIQLDALLDTASQWCILPARVSAEMGHTVQPGSEALLSTRLGVIGGWLERITVTFTAEEGEPLETEATWFHSPDWTGPPVIGWKGCLERIRFALDPSEEQFYFADL
jgi:hypothetical protein